MLKNLRNKKNKAKKIKINKVTTKNLPIKNLKVEDIQLHSKDVWRLWKEWLDRTNKIKNTTITNTIGKRDKNKVDHKANFYQYGD